jgi:hypothetical protein
MFTGDLALSLTTLTIIKLLMNRKMPPPSWKMNRHDA